MISRRGSETLIACDGVDCSERYTTINSSSYDIVFEIERIGWSAIGGKILCPEHKAKNDDFDPVKKPKHYNTGRIQPIEAIDDWKLGFALGNAVKYIARAAHKGSELEDLKKAAWYLNHRIEELQNSISSVRVTKADGMPCSHAYKDNDVRAGQTACGMSVRDTVIMCGPESLKNVDCTLCLGLLKSISRQNSERDGFRCPFCKGSEIKERLNPGQVACASCGATAAWPEMIRAEGVERELCDLTLKLMTMTGTSKLDDALRDLQIAWDFVMKHEERNPTHLMLDGVDKRGIACGKKDLEVSSVVTAAHISEVTCKDCRAAFMRTSR